ncbi:hypothetical protein ZTR_05059 [Talaromyces verruculosus]|nr:hypothetical protein ZTR_05059 [Talaromyces verruculosus]
MLSYDMRNPAQPQVTAWGYGTKSSTDTYTWFKLGLAQDQGQEIFDDTLLYNGLGSIKCPANLTYDDLATDYLRSFYEHLLEKIQEQEGHATFDLLALHFILAVPAGWPDVSRHRIKSCAERAGFGSREGDKISLIAEPEAAALAMFHSYSSKVEAGGTFKENTNVMVVDMGGGTVDLITYTIKQLRPFRVAEACVGSGSKCGSSTIDRHFQKLMEERFGDAYTSKSEKVIGPKSPFMTEFEEVKRRFIDTTLIDGIRLDLGLEDSKYYNKEDAEVTLTSEDLVELFRPVVDNVIELIKEQAERTKAENEHPLSAIILCGGLAGSGYIQTTLKSFCKKTIPGAEEKYRWLKNASIHVGGKFGYQGVIEIYQCDSLEAPLWKSDKGVTRLGDLPIDLTHLDPSTKKNAEISHIPGRVPDMKSVKVEIGQVIKSSNVVEFIARIGKRTIGLASFDYAPIAKSEAGLGEEEEEDNSNAWLRSRSESPLMMHSS